MKINGLQIKISIPITQVMLLKAPYSSKIDIFIPIKCLKNINTIIKYGIRQPVKFQFASRS